MFYGIKEWIHELPAVKLFVKQTTLRMCLTPPYVTTTWRGWRIETESVDGHLLGVSFDSGWLRSRPGKVVHHDRDVVPQHDGGRVREGLHDVPTAARVPPHAVRQVPDRRDRHRRGRGVPGVRRRRRRDGGRPWPEGEVAVDPNAGGVDERREQDGQHHREALPFRRRPAARPNEGHEFPDQGLEIPDEDHRGYGRHVRRGRADGGLQGRDSGGERDRPEPHRLHRALPPRGSEVSARTWQVCLGDGTEEGYPGVREAARVNMVAHGASVLHEIFDVHHHYFLLFVKY